MAVNLSNVTENGAYIKQVNAGGSVRLDTVNLGGSAGCVAVVAVISPVEITQEALNLAVQELHAQATGTVLATGTVKELSDTVVKNGEPQTVNYDAFLSGTLQMKYAEHKDTNVSAG